MCTISGMVHPQARLLLVLQQLVLALQILREFCIDVGCESVLFAGFITGKDRIGCSAHGFDWQPCPPASATAITVQPARSMTVMATVPMMPHVVLAAVARRVK